jgi:predicted DNA-binding protein
MRETFDRFQLLWPRRQRVALTRLAKARGKTLTEITREAIEIGIREMEQENEFVRREKGLKSIKALHAKILAHTGGKPLVVNPVEDLHHIREERIGQLGSGH